jgi:hypothetical protein
MSRKLLHIQFRDRASRTNGDTQADTAPWGSWEYFDSCEDPAVAAYYAERERRLAPHRQTVVTSPRICSESDASHDLLAVLYTTPT